MISGREAKVRGRGRWGRGLLEALLPAIALAMLGWWAYPSLLALAAPSGAAGVATGSVQAALTHRLVTIAPLVLVGLLAGLGARRSLGAYGPGLALLLGVGLVSFAGAVYAFGPDALLDAPAPGVPGVLLPLEAFALWKAGLTSVVCVVAAALMPGRRRRGVTRPAPD